MAKPQAPVDFEPGRVPTPDDVRTARLAAGRTQTEAAADVYLGHYRRWGEYESGQVGMDPAKYELFLVKHGLHPRFGAGS